MNIQHLFPLSLSLITAAVLSVCATQDAPTASKNESVVQPKSTSIPSRRAGSESKVLSDYSQYQSAVDATKHGDDAWIQQFLFQASNSAMVENVHNGWLKTLGARGQWDLFRQEFGKLNAAGVAQEVQCYADPSSGSYSKVVELVRVTGKLSADCTRLVESATASSRLDTSDVWHRVHSLLSNSQTTDARNLAAALGSPFEDGVRGATEYGLLSVIDEDARRSASVAATLSDMEPGLNREQRSFTWGVLGHYHAQSQNMPAALSYYGRISDRKQLTDEQLEWYTRAALCLQRWDELASVIQHMPEELQKDPTQKYWLGRSFAAQGKSSQAKETYEKAAASGRSLHTVLAGEELGHRINTCNNVSDVDTKDVRRMSENGAIKRALVLFKDSQSNGDSKMRRQAQAEWRFVIRGLNEDNLLTAAQVAFDNQFYNMVINSAGRTDHKLNYKLRYISPSKDPTVRYAAQAGIDPAWVYGSIRQKSRSVMGAQSSIGAQGLMQVMPAITREITGKIGMSSSELYTMDGNIRMGTWYMADAKRHLQNNGAMATTGYNAGPGRARNQQASSPLEDAIYVETIPFTETHDYVKKVMTSAAYYASLFSEPQTLLKQRMDAVPGRY